jgi:DNA-binding NarL/FixJ family response regulator
MEAAQKIKILLVDDHKILRDGLQLVLGSTDDIEVIGSVPSGEEAINYVRENRPDLILMDIMMGGMTGIEATRWIKDFDSTIKVVLLTMEISKEYVDLFGISTEELFMPSPLKQTMKDKTSVSLNLH